MLSNLDKNEKQRKKDFRVDYTQKRANSKYRGNVEVVA